MNNTIKDVVERAREELLKQTEKSWGVIMTESKRELMMADFEKRKAFLDTFARDIVSAVEGEVMWPKDQLAGADFPMDNESLVLKLRAQGKNEARTKVETAFTEIKRSI